MQHLAKKDFILIITWAEFACVVIAARKTGDAAAGLFFYLACDEKVLSLYNNQSTITRVPHN